MKKIGYIDYYLDEYHAHRGITSLKELNEQNGTDYTVTHVWAEIDKEGGLSTADFCAKYGVESCATIAELTEKVDYIIILAPDNSERKLDYALEAIKARKPIFLDKTFTDSYASAVKIFETAKEYGTKFFSASSLRYATELSEYTGTADSVLVWGSGVDLIDYAVHYIEIVMKTMGKGAKSVCWEKRGDQEWAEIVYADGRKATLCISMGGDYFGFYVFPTQNGHSKYLPIASNIFGLQMADVVRFFETGEVSFDTDETLELMKIRDGILQSKAQKGVWVEL